MIFDPKLVVAGLCLFLGTLALAFVMRQWRRWRLRAVIAPRPMAFAGTNLQSDFDTAKPRTANSGAKTIAIIHDFGLPYGQPTDAREYLTVREAFEVLAEIRAAGATTPLNIVLHTPGGSAFACEMIAAAIKDRPNTTAYVPYCAMSAGTIIALASEKIVMGRFACLGPIDTQYGPFAAESFLRLMKEKPIADIEDFTVLLSYTAEKDLKNAKARACDLLNKSHFSHGDSCQLTDFLVAGDLPHSEQIGRTRAVELGVNVAQEDCPDAVYKMVEARLELLRGGQTGGFDPNMALKKPQ